MDEEIIALLMQRDEAALQLIRREYGSICMQTAMRILENQQDAEETVNDALLRVWHAIPPAHPENLQAYLCTIVRRLALNRQAQNHAVKRGGGMIPQHDDALDTVSAPDDVERSVEEKRMLDALHHFLDTLSPETRALFVQRYTAQRTIPEIAKMYRMTESKVGVTLMRTRKKLKAYLKEEGWL